MAETVVLAELTIDASGAVSGVAAVDKAFVGLGRRTTEVSTTAKNAAGPLAALTSRMFNLRTAAVALLGTFTLGGLVLGLKNFIADIYRAAPGFKDFQTAVQGATSSLTSFIAQAIGASRTLDSLTTILNSVRTGVEAVKRIAGGETVGNLWRFMWGLTPIGKVERMLELTASVLNRAGVGGPGGPQTGGAPLGSAGVGAIGGLGFLDVPAAPGAKRRPGPYIAQAIRIPESLDTLGPLHDLLVDLFQPIEEVALGFESINDEMAKMSVQNIPELSKTVPEFKSVFDELAQSLRMTNLEFEALTLASHEMGSELASAIAGTGASFREAVVDILTSLSRLAFTYALMNVAFGIMASTGAGAALLAGTPSTFFKAAAKFAAVGIAAGLAARAVSGQGEESGGALAGAVGGPSGGGRTINITVNGSVIGGGNDAAIGRWLEDLLRRGERTNR
jgi:hypothetical protein